MRFKTKMNIFFIALKLLLCITIMASSTLALFTDSENGSVCVTAGDMEVRLSQWVPDDIDDPYVDISNKDGDVFGKADLWEPGQTRVVFFRVNNDSNIPIKYLLNMTVSLDELGGAFEYCAFQSGYFDTAGKSWESFTDGHEVCELRDGTNAISGDTHLRLEVDGEAYYALAIHMLEDDANMYMDKTAEINIHLFAVQGNVSENSLDAAAAAKD